MSFSSGLIATLTGTTGISSAQEPCEATSVGSWGVREETDTYSLALHARTCPVTGQGSHTPAAPAGLMIHQLPLTSSLNHARSHFPYFTLRITSNSSLCYTFGLSSNSLL